LIDSPGLSAGPSTGLRAGAARVDITPRTPNYLAGYGARNKPHTGVHDPLALRALWVRGGNGLEAVVIVADILWFGREAAERVTAQLELQFDLPPERVLLAGTHTHAAPVAWGERVDREWLQGLVSQAVAAAAIAKTRLRPVRMAVARGRSDIGINRRERLDDGTIVLGKNPGGPCDRELVAVTFDDTEGYAVAALANFACHGVVMSQENDEVSADWPGRAARGIERRNAGAPFLLLQGGAGNVNPRIGPQQDFGVVEDLGGEFEADWFKAVATATPQEVGDDRVDAATASIELPRKGRGQGFTPVLLRGLRIGPLCLVGFPGEVFSETSMALKRGAGARSVLACSYAMGGDDGYLPVREAYATGGYEVDVTPYADTAEGRVREALASLVAKLGGRPEKSQ
jgi:hypothetical protein